MGVHPLRGSAHIFPRGLQFALVSVINFKSTISGLRNQDELIKQTFSFFPFYNFKNFFNFFEHFKLC